MIITAHAHACNNSRALMNVMRAAPHTCKNAATFSFVIRTLYIFNDCAFPIFFLPNLGQFF